MGGGSGILLLDELLHYLPSTWFEVCHINNRAQ